MRLFVADKVIDEVSHLIQDAKRNNHGTLDAHALLEVATGGISELAETARRSAEEEMHAFIDYLQKGGTVLGTQRY